MIEPPPPHSSPSYRIKKVLAHTSLLLALVLGWIVVLLVGWCTVDLYYLLAAWAGR